MGICFFVYARERDSKHLNPTARWAVGRWVRAPSPPYDLPKANRQRVPFGVPAAQLPKGGAAMRENNGHPSGTTCSRNRSPFRRTGSAAAEKISTFQRTVCSGQTGIFQKVLEFPKRICYNTPTCRIRISVIQRLPKP